MTLAVNNLVTMAYETAKNNGFHDRTGIITPMTPEAQLAALVPVLKAFTAIVEAVRKPEKLGVTEVVKHLYRAAAAPPADRCERFYPSQRGDRMAHGTSIMPNLIPAPPRPQQMATEATTKRPPVDWTRIKTLEGTH